MSQHKNKTRFSFFPQTGVSIAYFLADLVVSIFIIAALAKYFTASFEDYLTTHVRDMAMNQAKIIASNDSIITAVKHRDYTRLATIADKLQSGTDFDYVVIGDENSIRLYHPNPQKLATQCSSPSPVRWQMGKATLLPGRDLLGWQCALKRPFLMMMARLLAWFR